MILCVFWNNAHSQSISEVNNALDNTFYRFLDFDYKASLQLPDSTQKKVIAVLNGYLPPKEIKDAVTFDDMIIKNIERMCKEICGTDSLCNALAKDSIIKKASDSQLYNLQQYTFPANFILAIGTWGVKDAEPILLKNINNERYPKRETKLALAKLGNDSIKRRIVEEYSINYIINNTVLKNGNPNLIYKSIPSGESVSDQISYFFEASRYLKKKEILLNMIDLLDIQGKYYSFSEIAPIEESVMMWLCLRFIEKQYFENGKLDEWENITETYFNAIVDNKNSPEISNILSHESKEQVKKQMKNWIEENVNFEE